MNAPATHPCDACGGTGQDFVAIERAAQTLFERLETDEAHATCRVNHIGPADRIRLVAYRWSDGMHVSIVLNSPRCPVCLGAGRISDRMPAADAVADAETLRLFVGERLQFNPGFRTAERCGEIAAHVLLHIKPRARKAHAQGIELAVEAAHAALDAIPELRG